MAPGRTSDSSGRGLITISKYGNKQARPRSSSPVQTPESPSNPLEKPSPANHHTVNRHFRTRQLQGSTKGIDSHQWRLGNIIKPVHTAHGIHPGRVHRPDPRPAKTARLTYRVRRERPADESSLPTSAGHPDSEHHTRATARAHDATENARTPIFRRCQPFSHTCVPNAAAGSLLIATGGRRYGRFVNATNPSLDHPASKVRDILQNNGIEPCRFWRESAARGAATVLLRAGIVATL